jgi:RimJ/RimL family protein N-acetyltransferase
VIVLRQATADDAELLLTWRNEPTTRQASFDTGNVDRETHIRWLDRRLTDPRCVLLIVTIDGEPAGQLRIDLEDNDKATVSIGLAPRARGRRLAAPALRLAEPVAREHGAVRLVAQVKADNEPSLRAFRRSGYHEVGRTAQVVTLERKL